MLRRKHHRRRPPESYRRVLSTEADRITLAQRRQAERDLHAFATRLGWLLAVVIVVVVGGSIAYAAFERTSVAYGFYWTLDTVTTLGAVSAPHTDSGRVILVILELTGIGTLSYGLATVAQFVVSGHLSRALSLRRTQKMIDSYSDHYIVCGFGRVGRQVVRDLLDHDAEIVVIDHNPIHRDAANATGVAYIEGHASDDEVLVQAGISRALAVIACVDSDAENIFIALSARGLSAQIKVIARASSQDAERKLIRAGADQVISPYTMTGKEMARIALAPVTGGAA